MTRWRLYGLGSTPSAPTPPDPAAVAYCAAIVAPDDRSACAARATTARRDREALPQDSVTRTFTSKRSYRKGLQRISYNQVNFVPQPYRNPGCDEGVPPEPTLLADGSPGPPPDPLHSVRVALQKARIAYAKLHAALNAVSLRAPPPSSSVARLDHLYPGVPTNDPRAVLLWDAIQALEALIPCLRHIQDASLREDILLPLAAEALYQMHPSLLAHDGRPAMSVPRNALASAIDATESLAGNLALYIYTAERQLLGGPIVAALQKAVVIAGVIAGLSALRTSFLWVMHVRRRRRQR